VNGYQQMIAKIIKDVPAYQVEAWMRLKFGTLDNLHPEDFKAEARFAAKCVRQCGASVSKDLANSYGLHAEGGDLVFVEVK
jgi:hypothetical protein